MPKVEMLRGVVEELRGLLLDPGNDFSWSSWEDSADAVGEVDGILGDWGVGRLGTLEVLFAPTGPVQEVAISSGWGDAFRTLADRFDAAVAGDDIWGAWACSSALGHWAVRTYLGMDSAFGEVSVLECSECGGRWVSYEWVDEAVTGSGRWYLGLLPAGVEVTVENGRGVLEGLPQYLMGGSYLGGERRWGAGEIRVG